MGNSLPCMAYGATSNVTKEKLHGCNVFLNQLHKLKQKPKPKAHHHVAKETNNGSNMGLSKDQHVNDGGGGGVHEKGIIRVKVVLTKKEAAQLLSMCVRREKDMARIAAELKRSMEMSSLANGVPHGTGWRPGLETIPEEWE